MILPPFTLHRPTSLEEAVATAARHHDEGVDYIAGGTDLLQNYKNRLHPRPHLVSLLAIPGLAAITPTSIGALATLADIAASPAVAESLPAVGEAASVVASVLVRNTATLGGNLLVDTRCHFLNQSAFWRQAKGSCLKAESDDCLVVPQKETCWATSSSDLAPAVMALGATIHTLGPEGEREMPAAEFYRHDGIARHHLAPGEIITRVSFPPTAATLRSGYEKLRVRDTFDYPLLGIAAALSLAPDNTLQTLQVVLGAVSTYPQAQDAITAPHLGQPLTDEAITAMAAAMSKAAEPKKNVSLSPAYRKKMVAVLSRRLLTALRDS